MSTVSQSQSFYVFSPTASNAPRISLIPDLSALDDEGVVLAIADVRGDIGVGLLEAVVACGSHGDVIRVDDGITVTRVGFDG